MVARFILLLAALSAAGQDVPMQISHRGSQVTLTWPKTPNALYLAEYKASLNQSNWTIIGNVTAVGAGTNGYMYAETKVTSQAFFRLRKM